MEEFFSFLAQHGMLNELANTLDWLVDEQKFAGDDWDSSRKTTFSRTIHGTLFPNPYVFESKSRERDFPDANTCIETPYALFAGKSMSDDFIRHIGNGIAHGHARGHMIGNEAYVETKDYHSGRQTAHILIPIEYLNSIYQIYLGMDEQ